MAFFASPAGSIPLEVFAPEGTPAPGVPGDRPFSQVESLEGIPGGKAVFVASVEGLDSEFNRVVWLRGEDGSLRELARRRDTAPGRDDAFFFNFGESRVRPDGTVLFQAEIRGLGVDGSAEGVWRADPDGSLSLVAEVGGTLPGLPEDATIERLDVSAGNGELFLSARLTANTLDRSWWRVDPSGELEPLLLGGVRASYLGPDGRAVFQSGRSLLVRDPDGTLTTIGVRVPQSADVDGSRRGDLAFVAEGGPQSQQIWYAAPGEEPGPLVVDGQAAPGLEGFEFRLFSNLFRTNLSVDEAGRLAFTALVRDPSGAGADRGVLWVREPDGELRPWLLPGADIGGLDAELTVLSTSESVLDERGGVILRGEIPGEDGEPSPVLVLARGPDSALVLYGEGDVFEVAPGDLRSVGSAFSVFVAADVRGRIVSRLRFADGSEGLVFATVPEPATALMLAAGLAALSRWRARSPRPASG